MREVYRFGAFFLLWAFTVWLAVRAGFSAVFTSWVFGAVLLLAVVVAWFGLRGVRVERSFNALRLTEGERWEVAVNIALRSWIPLPWLFVRDLWQDETSGQTYLIGKLLFPWFRRQLTVAYRLDRLPRGIYRSLGAELSAGDPFGLLQRHKRLADGVRMIVEPRPLDAEQAFAARLLGGSGNKGVHADPSGLPAGVRDYAPGDPERRIHWKATARTGKLKVKEGERAPSERRVILLDASAVSYADMRSGRSERFERAVRLTAGLVRQAARSGAAWSLAHSGAERRRTGADGNAGAEGRARAGGDSGTNGHAKSGSHAKSDGNARTKGNAGMIGKTEKDGRTGGDGNAGFGGKPLTAAIEEAAVVLAGLRPDGPWPFAERVVSVGLQVPVGTAVVCVTPKLNEALLAGALALNARRRKVLIVYVPENAAGLTPAEEAWRRRVERAGCGFALGPFPHRAGKEGQPHVDFAGK